MADFLTLQVSNTTNNSIPLSFSSNFQLPLLDRASDYDVSVVRFKVPNFKSPFVTMRDNYYKMYMSYNNFVVERFIQIIQRTSTVTNYVFDFQQMVQMLNATIDLLFADLGALVILPTADKPYFIYNETTTHISFIAHKDFYMSNLVTPIVISLNEPLFLWIAGIPCLNDANQNEILVFDAHNNVSGNYVTMTQQTNTLDLISDFSAVVFTSSFPTKNEFVGDNVRLPILQDFTPQDLDIKTYYNNIVYNAIVPYRQVRLLSNMAIHNVQIDCYIANIQGELRRAVLPPGQTSNIKIMFTKHSTNKYA